MLSLLPKFLRRCCLLKDSRIWKNYLFTDIPPWEEYIYCKSINIPIRSLSNVTIDNRWFEIIPMPSPSHFFLKKTAVTEICPNSSSWYFRIIFLIIHSNILLLLSLIYLKSNSDLTPFWLSDWILATNIFSSQNLFSNWSLHQWNIWLWKSLWISIKLLKWLKIFIY